MPTPPSSHEIGVDILAVEGRPCRPYQERIEEYAMDGRPRFAWEVLRSRWILGQDPAIVEICASCPLNIFQGAEGCRGTVEGLDLFFKAVGRIAPDSPWNDFPLDGRPVDSGTNRRLHAALAELEERFEGTPWTVAQVYRDGRPLVELLSDGTSRPRFYPWNGEAPPEIITSNTGYQVFLCPHGLIVKATYEDPVPHTFRKLWRDESGVFGQSAGGETVGFQMSLAHYPEWDPEEPTAPGELVMSELPASQVFRDPLDVLSVFTGVAQEADTGIWIRPA